MGSDSQLGLSIGTFTFTASSGKNELFSNYVFAGEAQPVLSGLCSTAGFLFYEADNGLFSGTF
jgi:hypothetical protein